MFCEIYFPQSHTRTRNDANNIYISVIATMLFSQDLDWPDQTLECVAAPTAHPRHGMDGGATSVHPSAHAAGLNQIAIDPYFHFSIFSPLPKPSWSSLLIFVVYSVGSGNGDGGGSFTCWGKKDQKKIRRSWREFLIEHFRAGLEQDVYTTVISVLPCSICDPNPIRQNRSTSAGVDSKTERAKSFAFVHTNLLSGLARLFSYNQERNWIVSIWNISGE